MASLLELDLALKMLQKERESISVTSSDTTKKNRYKIIDGKIYSVEKALNAELAKIEFECSKAFPPPK